MYVIVTSHTAGFALCLGIIYYAGFLRVENQFPVPLALLELIPLIFKVLLREASVVFKASCNGCLSSHCWLLGPILSLLCVHVVSLLGLSLTAGFGSQLYL